MDKEVKKHVAAIRISDTVGLLSRKTWNVLLLNAYDNLMQNDFHKIKVSELCEIVGCHTRNSERIDDVLSNLVTTKVKWDIGGGCTENGTWIKNMGVSTMLASAVIENGVISYEFSKRLSKLLYNPEMYQKINLLHQKAFKSSSSLALWENCIRFSGVGKTGLSEVREWRELLGATAKTYDKYKDFNKFVLNTSIKEINEVSNIQIELITKRTGRSITHIGFTVKQKRQTQLAIPEIVSELKSSKEFEEMIAYGINEIQAMSWIQEYGYPYIREKIDYVTESVKSGKVKSSVSGLLASAIKNDFKDGKKVLIEQKKKQSVEKNKEQLEDKKIKLIGDLTREFEREEKKLFIASLTDDQVNELKNEISEKISVKNQTSQDSFKKLGLNSPFVGVFITPKIAGYEENKQKFIEKGLKKAGY